MRTAALSGCFLPRKKLETSSAWGQVKILVCLGLETIWHNLIAMDGDYIRLKLSMTLDARLEQQTKKDHMYHVAASDADVPEHRPEYCSFGHFLLFGWQTDNWGGVMYVWSYEIPAWPIVKRMYSSTAIWHVLFQGQFRPWDCKNVICLHTLANCFVLASRAVPELCCKICITK